MNERRALPFGVVDIFLIIFVLIYTSTESSESIGKFVKTSDGSPSLSGLIRGSFSISSIYLSYLSKFSLALATILAVSPSSITFIVVYKISSVSEITLTYRFWEKFSTAKVEL